MSIYLCKLPLTIIKKECIYTKARKVISCGLFDYSNEFSHTAATASDGIRQSPRGESATLPTFTPSGRQERLNCWAKKRV